ncbi:hypothetical protein TIFTF001_043873 [Ficus carica]|uniref:Uncharacterized protein n=1 Tax=Ficus carica TaxID=3494 RepID=A0AA88CP02_FICCA|nr:hypothetical protein TIFTF001_043868 [Ficus carica]GMN25255.1 hypothetical protein TIFTF001_043873 [Ficus carica]
MDEVCVFVKYNGQWDGTLRYVGGEMKGILVPVTATYVGLIELVISVIGIRGLDKTIVMRYGVEPGMPPVRIQCDADVKFYIQLKKKDVHVLSKFPISIDVFNESAAEAMLPEVGESNHIDVQPSREGGQSDEAMQPVNDSNLIILPPRPPHIPSTTIGLNLHTKYGIEKKHQLLNNDLCTNHDDCIAGELNIADVARHSNEKSIAGCPWQLRAIRMRGSELFVVKRYDDVHTCSIEIVQGHHRQAKSWMIRECVKTKYLDPTNTSYRPREIMRDMQADMQAEFGVSFNYLRAWRGKEAALTSLRGDDAESYKDAAFRICVQHLAANLKTRWFVERREEALKITSKLAPKAEILIRTNFSLGLTVTSRLADQVEYAVTNNAVQIWIVDMSERTSQKAGMFLKKSDRKLSILPIQSVVPEGHEFIGFCPKVKNMRLFGVVDVMVIDTTDKPVLTQYPYAYVQQQGPRHRSQLPVQLCDDFFSHFTFIL